MPVGNNFAFFSSIPCRTLFQRTLEQGAYLKPTRAPADPLKRCSVLETLEELQIQDQLIAKKSHRRVVEVKLQIQNDLGKVAKEHDIRLAEKPHTNETIIKWL